MEAFSALGLKTRSSSPEDIFPLLDLFFARRESGALGPGQRERTRATIRRSPVEALPGDLILFGRVIGLLRGVCASLGAPLSPMEMLRPFAEQALAAERCRPAFVGTNFNAKVPRRQESPELGRPWRLLFLAFKISSPLATSQRR